MSRRDRVGVFTTDLQLVVQSWDRWMIDATGLSEAAACGESITRIIPDLAQRGLLSRLHHVASGAGVEVLAPAFHKYLIPCPPRDPASRFERMRQHVTIAPLRDYGGIVGLIVTIEDVTPRLDRDLQLVADLDSHDEAVRLRAAETLAAGGEAPSLLAGALADDSWRVRRVAAEGMAASGGREVVDKLVEVLRHHNRDLGLLNASLTALSRTREDIVMTIVGFLADDEAEVRTYAALALGLIGDPRAVGPLKERLNDADVNVRFHAIEALGRIRDADAVSPLATVALSRDFFLSFAALDALAAIGDASIVPQLLELLDEEILLPAVVACLGALAGEEAVVPLAQLLEQAGAPVGITAKALVDIYDRIQQQIGEGALVADLTRSVIGTDTVTRVLAALGSASDDELPALLHLLAWLRDDRVNEVLAGYLPHATVGRNVAELLAGRGINAAVHVERVAEEQSAAIKELAAGVLGRIGSRSSVPLLLRWLSSEEEVTIAVANALGAIGDARAFEPLLSLLDHPESSIRQAAVAALNSIGHPRTEESIAGRLKSDSPRVRESAARIAGYFGYGSCLRRLVELCDDEDELVRRSVVEHLASFDERQAWSKIRELLASDPSATVRSAAVRALGQSTSDTLAQLIAATRDSSLWVRYYAIRVIATHTTHADALTRLAECATRDPAPPVRIAAIEALATAGSASMIGALLPLVHDSEPEVAYAAVAALGSFKSTESAVALGEALKSSDGRMQRAALDAFAKRESGPVGDIAAMARHGRDLDLREHATRTLGHIANDTAIEALLVLATDPLLRPSTTLALTSIASIDIDSLTSHLSRADEKGRRLIVDALARVKNPAATAALAVALNDPLASVRVAAARALSRFDMHEARSQLSALARTDESLAVRTAARDALASG